MPTDWLKTVGKAVRVTVESTAEVVRETAASTADAVRTTAGVGVGSIAIDVKQTDYKPGDTVAGKITLALEEATDAQRLVVRLYAVGTRTHFVKNESGKTLAQERETLYKFDLEVDGEKTYEEGAHMYEFSIRIPTDAENEAELPEAGIVGDVLKFASSLSQGIKRPTTWTLRAFLDIPWKRNLKKELEIQVAGD